MPDRSALLGVAVSLVYDLPSAAEGVVHYAPEEISHRHFKLDGGEWVATYRAKDDGIGWRVYRASCRRADDSDIMPIVKVQAALAVYEYLIEQKNLDIPDLQSLAARLGNFGSQYLVDQKVARRDTLLEQVEFYRRILDAAECGVPFTLEPPKPWWLTLFSNLRRRIKRRGQS